MSARNACLGWVRTRLFYVIAVAVLAMIVTAVVMLLPEGRAAADPNLCGPWHDEEDIADTTSASCRATFLVDPGIGNTMSREDLLAAADFYQTQGFDRQWLWYAPVRTVVVNDTSAQEWTSCAGVQPRVDGNACGTTPVEHHPMLHGGALVATSLSLSAFAFDGRVVARVCGNYFWPPVGDNPVPTVLVEKYDDRNRNGARDPGETGLPGWQFRVKRIASKYHDQNPGVVATITTGGAGLVRYAFSGAGPGTYAIEEIGQDGWAPTTAAQQTIVVEDGIGDSEVAHLRFGNAQTRADLVKVSFELVDPPQRLDAHVTTELVVRARIRNNGPADVAVTDAVDVTTTQPDCRIEPAHDEATRVLLAGASAVEEFRIGLTCDLPSYHPITFTDHLSVTTPGVQDPVLENNTVAFQHVFEVYDKADVQLAGTTVTCPPRADVDEMFECSVAAEVTNAGPYEPITADVTFSLQPPSDCRADNADGANQTLSLPVGQPIVAISLWRVTCGQRSFHDIAANAHAVLRHLHVEDPKPDNAAGNATTSVEIFEPVDLVAEVIDLRCDEREANTTASSCTAGLVVRNDGPATHVAVLTTLTITTELDCTADPTAPVLDHLVLDAGESVTVPATWLLTCTGSHRHSVLVQGTVLTDEPHAEDRWPANNSMSTVWGPSDIKPTSLPSSINIGKNGVVPFAIVSTPTLNALTDIDVTSLLFGRTGTENSVISCASEGEDVDGDGRLDRVCRARTELLDLSCTTTVALITGRLTDGTRYQSEDTVKVTGCH